MSRESDFLLGTAFGLLTQAREFMITHEVLDGVALIEDQYQRLSAGIDNHYYGKENKEIKDGK